MTAPTSPVTPESTPQANVPESQDSDPLNTTQEYFYLRIPIQDPNAGRVNFHRRGAVAIRKYRDGVHVSASLCSAEDSFNKVTARDKALGRLQAKGTGPRSHKIYLNPKEAKKISTWQLLTDLGMLRHNTRNLTPDTVSINDKRLQNSLSRVLST